MKKKLSVSMALVLALLLIGAVALASELVLRSNQLDVKLAAQEALEAKYGLTKEMLGVFAAKQTKDGEQTIFTYTPLCGDALKGRIGAYTVTMKDGRAEATWTNDGVAMTEGLSSPAWGKEQLDLALKRRATGEQWYELVEQTYPERLPEEKAIALAGEAILEKYGAGALDGFECLDAHIVIDNETTGVYERYSLWFAKTTDKGTEQYSALLDAGSGSVLELNYTSAEENAAFEAEIEKSIQEGAAEWARTQERAKAQAKVTLTEAVEIAKAAVTEIYGLTPAQIAQMYQEDDDVYYSLDGEKLTVHVCLRLTQSEGDYAAGDGMYWADIDALTGVVMDIDLDPGMGGNG